ncbi:hypothetical protein EDD11_009887 [Mortierella claussenii]|nr:hypothetical protein EDD11_009887 [Mortierella claussenii]
MNESEGSKGPSKEAWKNEIDTARVGAGYFLSFKGKPEFKPLEYVSFRGLTSSEAQRLLPAEWIQWVQDLKASPSEHVRRRAVSAPTLTVDAIHGFYKARIVDNHELELLGESSQQVVNGGRELGTLMHDRQRQPNHITMTTSALVSISQGAVTLPAVRPASKRTMEKAGDDIETYQQDNSASNHEQQHATEADSSSDTEVETGPATTEFEPADGDTETEASLAILESELSLSQARSSPFYELVNYIYKKVCKYLMSCTLRVNLVLSNILTDRHLVCIIQAQQKQVALPNIPNDLTPIHSEMFRLARDELTKPGDVMKKKHVFCLVSGIVNTLMPIGRSLSISSAVEAASIAPALQYESQTIRTLQEELLAALYPDAEDPGSMDVSNLRRTVYLRLAEAEQEPRKSKGVKERYAVLQILTLILLWLANRKFDKPSPEHVFVSAWSDVFNALFQGANLRVIPGELTSGASKKSRQLAEDEFGGETVESKKGRKVDLTLRVMVAGGAWKGEVAVFEGKPQVSDKTCQTQQQKSVRLNAAILSDLEDLGLDTNETYLVVAETRALAVDFYTLRRHGSVFGAGRATERRVWLPAHPTELKAFLRSDSLQVLLGFRSHTIQYASEAASVLTAAPPSPFPVQGDVGPSRVASTEFQATTAVLPHATQLLPPNLTRQITPPPRKRTRPFIVFSPSKSNKKKLKRRNEDDISEHEDDE